MLNAEYFFQAKKKAKAEDIAAYFADLALFLQEKGYKKADIFFDRNSTHKKKMRRIFAELSKHLSIIVNFHFIAAYSPQLNLVEYVIHWIRQKLLHHADARKSLPEFEKLIHELCQTSKIVSKEQIINILAHIESLVFKE